VCADIDANGWLNGVDAVSITEMDDEDGDKPANGAVERRETLRALGAYI